MLCHVFPYRVAEGPTNMALDEAMLEAVARDPSAARLRTYGWSTPTLSLGYFQSWAEVERDPRWRSAAKVRRATGGGAIWHEHELTFAIVIPSSHPLARPHTAQYRAVHDAAAGLPLIASEIPYVRERSDEEGATLLLPRSDPEGSADRAAAFLSNPAWMGDLAVRARQGGLLHTSENWYLRRAEWTFDAYDRHYSRAAKPPNLHRRVDHALN